MPSRAPAGAHTMAPAMMSPSNIGPSAVAHVPLQRGVAEDGHRSLGVLPVEVDERLVQLAERGLGQAEPRGHAGIDEHEGPVSHGAWTLPSPGTLARDPGRHPACRVASGLLPRSERIAEAQLPVRSGQGRRGALDQQSEAPASGEPADRSIVLGEHRARRRRRSGCRSRHPRTTRPARGPRRRTRTVQRCVPPDPASRTSPRSRRQTS